MDILRNLFGNLAAGIIRLLVTVGILAAAYFFIVKPVLKTTDNAIKSTNSSFEKSFGGTGLDDLSNALDDVGHQVQVQVQRSFHSARKHGNPKKLVHCVEHAEGNVRKIRRCTVKY
jgi:predicted PurR-regulated permease PerM